MRIQIVTVSKAVDSLKPAVSDLQKHKDASGESAKRHDQLNARWVSFLAKLAALRAALVLTEEKLKHIDNLCLKFAEKCRLRLFEKSALE